MEHDRTVCRLQGLFLADDGDEAKLSKNIVDLLSRDDAVASRNVVLTILLNHQDAPRNLDAFPELAPCTGLFRATAGLLGRLVDSCDLALIMPLVSEAFDVFAKAGLAQLDWLLKALLDLVEAVKPVAKGAIVLEAAIRAVRGGPFLTSQLRSEAMESLQKYLAPGDTGLRLTTALMLLGDALNSGGNLADLEAVARFALDEAKTLTVQSWMDLSERSVEKSFVVFEANPTFALSIRAEMPDDGILPSNVQMLCAHLAHRVVAAVDDADNGCPPLKEIKAVLGTLAKKYDRADELDLAELTTFREVFNKARDAQGWKLRCYLDHLLSHFWDDLLALKKSDEAEYGEVVALIAGNAAGDLLAAPETRLIDLYEAEAGDLLVAGLEAIDPEARASTLDSLLDRRFQEHGSLDSLKTRDFEESLRLFWNTGVAPSSSSTTSGSSASQSEAALLFLLQAPAAFASSLAQAASENASMADLAADVVLDDRLSKHFLWRQSQQSSLLSTALLSRFVVAAAVASASPKDQDDRQRIKKASALKAFVDKVSQANGAMARDIFLHFAKNVHVHFLGDFVGILEASFRPASLVNQDDEDLDVEVAAVVVHLARMVSHLYQTEECNVSSSAFVENVQKIKAMVAGLGDQARKLCLNFGHPELFADLEQQKPKQHGTMASILDIIKGRCPLSRLEECGHGEILDGLEVVITLLNGLVKEGHLRWIMQVIGNPVVPVGDDDESGDSAKLFVRRLCRLARARCTGACADDLPGDQSTLMEMAVADIVAKTLEQQLRREPEALETLALELAVDVCLMSKGPARGAALLSISRVLETV